MTDLERSRYPDDVLRIKDEMDMHAVLKQTGHWVAFHLADGKPLDHAAYPTWNDAVKAAKWDRDNMMYLEVQPDGMPYREAAAVLKFARFIHDQGHRIPDPDWADYEASVMPRMPHDRLLAARQLATGKPLYPDHVSYGNLPFLRRKDT